MNKLRTIILAAIALALLAGAVAVLTGCSGNPAAAPSASPSVAPTLELVAPAAGSTVPAGDVAMSVATTGLTFVMASNTNVAGEGHVHFTLDGQPFKMSVTPDYTYVGVEAGEHELVAELVQNDTKPFDPPVRQEITFKAE